MKILLVEDDVDFMEVMLDALGTRFAVITAKNGIEALSKFESEKPNAIVTDLDMPHKNGLELIRSVRNSGSEIPIILMSGSSSEDPGVKQASSSGADAFLAKPFSTSELFLTLDRLLAEVAQPPPS